MTWVFAVLIVLILSAVAVVAAGRGEPMSPAYGDRPDALVPAERALTGADLRRVRLPMALRGYRMSDVDALLDRVAAELDEHDARRSAHAETPRQPRSDAPAEPPRAGSELGDQAGA